MLTTFESVNVCIMVSNLQIRLDLLAMSCNFTSFYWFDVSVDGILLFSPAHKVSHQFLFSLFCLSEQSMWASQGVSYLALLSAAFEIDVKRYCIEIPFPARDFCPPFEPTQKRWWLCAIDEIAKGLVMAYPGNQNQMYFYFSVYLHVFLDMRYRSDI